MSTTADVPHSDLLSRGAVTIKQAVAEYGISRSRLYGLMVAGDLPYSQLGSRRLIPRLAIERLIASHLIGGADDTQA